MRILASTLLSIHNLRFLIKLMEEVKMAILEDRILEYKNEFFRKYGYDSKS